MSGLARPSAPDRDSVPGAPYLVASGRGFGDLAGTVAIVTGGSSGIGFGVARGLVTAGARVAVTGRSRERTDAAARALCALRPGHGSGFVCDVADEAATADTFQAVRDTWGGLDAVVASAGVGGAEVPFVDLSLDEWRRVMRVNLDGVFLAFREGARLMVADGTQGSLVAIGSLATVFGQVRGQSYSAGKGAVSALVRACAAELGRHGIRVNEILPGTIQTPMAKPFITTPGVSDRALRRIPARRWGEPDELAGAVVYLVSDAARYHSGDSLVVDGGYSVY